MASMKQGDDPKDYKVDEVNAYLEKADDAERDRVLAAESAGGGRKTILEPAGWDPDVKRSGSGRELFPWETDPVKAADKTNRLAQVAEGPLGANLDADAGPTGQQSPTSGSDPQAGNDSQPATTPAGSGTADAFGTGGDTGGTGV